MEDNRDVLPRALASMKQMASAGYDSLADPNINTDLKRWIFGFGPHDDDRMRKRHTEAIQGMQTLVKAKSSTYVVPLLRYLVRQPCGNS
jgi:hypothetical protein